MWGVTSQGLNSASNYVLSFFIAARYDAAVFAEFSVPVIVAMLVVGLVRAGLGTTRVVTWQQRSTVRDDEASFVVAATALRLGVLAGSLFAIVGITGVGRTSAWIAVGACLPFVLLQDACRFEWFARAAPQRSALSDALWMAAQIASLVLLTGAGLDSPVIAVMSWGLGAAAGLVGMPRGSLARTNARASRAWLVRHRRLSVDLVLDHGIGASVGYFALVLAAVVLATKGFAELRAAFLLLGPVNVVMSGAATVLLRHAAGVVVPDRRSAASLAAALSVRATGITGLLGGALLLAPEGAIDALLGETARGARQLLPIVVLGALAQSIAAGPDICLRAFGAVRLLVWIRLGSVVPFLAAPVVGGLLNGARGFAMGNAAVLGCVSVLLWLVFVTGERAERQPVLHA